MAGWARLTDVRAQRAFIHTIRAVIDIAGQRVSARDRLYLAHEVPTMIIWGDRDQVIPVSHAHIAHELMPGSRLEIVEGAGHFLPIQRPELVDRLLRDFLATTKPANVSPQRWQEVLRQHALGRAALRSGMRLETARKFALVAPGDHRGTALREVIVPREGQDHGDGAPRREAPARQRRMRGEGPRRATIPRGASSRSAGANGPRGGLRETLAKAAGRLVPTTGRR